MERNEKREKKKELKSRRKFNRREHAKDLASGVIRRKYAAELLMYSKPQGDDRT